ncbi:hypothetical protein G6F31_021698 [Rhizopus arrhizus]|nr:hypothetical protein G6F31_021698 [Rhizopus arrhizus]
MPRHHNDFRAGRGDTLENVHAIAARQPDVGQHQIRRLPLQLYERVLDAGRHGNRETAVAAQLGQGLSNRVVIVHDQQSLWRRQA